MSRTRREVNKKHIRRDLIQAFLEVLGEESVGTTNTKFRIRIKLFGQNGNPGVKSLDSNDTFQVYGYKDVFGMAHILTNGMLERDYKYWSRKYKTWRYDIENHKLDYGKRQLYVYLPGEKIVRYYTRKVKNMRRHEIQIQKHTREIKSNGKFGPWKYLKNGNKDGTSSFTFCIFGIIKSRDVTDILLEIMQNDAGFNYKIIYRDKLK